MMKNNFLLLSFSFLTVACSDKPQVDVVIQNGTIYDGTGKTPYSGTVAISGDKILYVVAPKSFKNPMQYSKGVNQVFINGTHVLENGSHTGSLPGKFIKGPGFGKEIKSTIK